MIASSRQINALLTVIRKKIDASGWGGWISNDVLRPIAVEGANVVVNAHPDKRCDMLFIAVRAEIDKSGYGSWVSDATLRPIIAEGVNAVINSGVVSENKEK